MAIVRVRGGNSGIAEYLREGQKQGRAFNRDELDMRVCLDGNLSLTENVIDSIPDKNQDRYLHITISFRENEVPIETLEAVTQEYKTMFLSAYNDDEVNFYAEAHLPKIKTITDRNTGEEKERKPHIHIVIPKTNLLTGRSLDPVGLYKHHEKYHEAIQEKLNTKFSLENPKDFVRLTDDHQAQILSRVKADTFKGFRADVKKEAFNILEQGNYRDYSAYKSALSQSFYEVRVRNEGKPNEYLAVKTSQDSNYINLKSPLFEKKYIEERKIERVKPTEKQVDRLLNDWSNRVSKEIKYINKASKKMQVMYRAADVEGKKEIILNRERGFYETARQYTDSGQTNKKHRYKNSSRGNLANLAVGLPEMRSGELVPNLDGYKYSGRERDFNASIARESTMLVREVQQNSLADGQQGQHQHNGLRWSARDTHGLDSVTGSISFSHSQRKAITADNELDEFRNIRKSLSADHLLNNLSNSHGITPSDYKLSTAKDGSARIGVGKINYNVSDFLTKEMKFSWDEAKAYLRKSYDEQINNEMSLAKVKLPKEIWQSFNAEYRPQYFQKIKDVRAELNYNCKRMRYDLKKTYWNEKKEIFSRKMSYAERKAALSVAVFNKLKNEKEIRQYQYRERRNLAKLENVETEFLILKYVQNSEGGSMAKLTDYVSGIAEKNTFSPFEPEYGVNLKRHMEQIKENDEFNIKNKKRLELNDLAPSKQDNGDVKYQSGLLKTTAFIDKGDKIEFPTFTLDKDKIALGLELASEKYNGKIQLTGTPGFKDKAIEIAAERGLEVEFRPKKFQERFEELKQQFAEQRQDAPRSQQGAQQQPDNKQPELVITGVNARELPLSELSRNDLRELGKNLSENNISFKEIAELSKAKPDISVEQAVKEILAKPENERAATAQELHVTTVYNEESNRTRIVVNDLPLDTYIQTASEIYKTDADIIQMPLLASDELSQFTPSQIEQGYAEGQISVPSITINENGRSIQNDVRVEFESIDGDSTAYRVIVNGKPMREAHLPDQAGHTSERNEQDEKIISHIKSVLEEKGLGSAYFSSENQSPLSQADRDVKNAELELAKEHLRQQNYVKTGNSETAKEHQYFVIEQLTEKLDAAKENRANVADKIASGEIKVEKADRELVITAPSMPKAFQLSSDGKAYDDAFQPRQYTATSNRAQEQQKQERQQDKPEQKGEKPKISFDR
ncbi:TPA: LPD7 domain-containing protein [Salmonella enterica]